MLCQWKLPECRYHSHHTLLTIPPNPPAYAAALFMRACVCVSAALALPPNCDALLAFSSACTHTLPLSHSPTLPLSYSPTLSLALSVCYQRASIVVRTRLLCSAQCGRLLRRQLPTTTALPLLSLLLLIADVVAWRGAGSVCGSGRPVELSQRSRAAGLCVCLSVSVAVSVAVAVAVAFAFREANARRRPPSSSTPSAAAATETEAETKTKTETETVNKTVNSNATTATTKAEEQQAAAEAEAEVEQNRNRTTTLKDINQSCFVCCAAAKKTRKKKQKIIFN